LSLPVQLLPATPSGAATTDDNVSGSGESPDAMTQALGTTGGHIVNLSDLLLASCSPSNRPGPIFTLSNKIRPCPKQSSSCDKASELAKKRKWNASTTLQADTTNFLGSDLFSSSSSSSSFGGNAVIKNPVVIQPKILKRKKSKPVDILSDDELVSPAHVPKRAVAVSNSESRGAKRARRGLLLCSISGTSSYTPLGQACLSSVIDSENSDDDELSFA
jgi:hypothetical protein